MSSQRLVPYFRMCSKCGLTYRATYDGKSLDFDAGGPSECDEPTFGSESLQYFIGSYEEYRKDPVGRAHQLFVEITHNRVYGQPSEIRPLSPVTVPRIVPNPRQSQAEASQHQPRSQTTQPASSEEPCDLFRSDALRRETIHTVSSLTFSRCLDLAHTLHCALIVRKQLALRVSSFLCVFPLLLVTRQEFLCFGFALLHSIGFALLDYIVSALRQNRSLFPEHWIIR
jgi:hypothetical protein